MTITILTIIHIMICIFMVVIVLLQKGADAGAAFGGSSGQALFGSEGPVSLLTKLTTLIAIVFMLTSVSLAYLSIDRTVISVMEEDLAPVQQEIPLGDTVPPPFPTPDDR